MYTRTASDDDVQLYSAITPCNCKLDMLCGLSSVVSFEACCQLALLSVQITSHYPTI